MSNVTIKDIADRTGVSYATVSRALNDRVGVNIATKELITKAAKEMGYMPNAIARSLVTKQSYTIALILPDISNPFFADIALAASAAAHLKGYHVLLCNTGWDVELEREQLAIMEQKRVDGIILKPADEVNSDFSNIHTPLVLLNHVYKGNLSYIELDNQKGGYMAGAHMIEGGCKRMGFIGGKKVSSSSRARLEGYKQAIKESGLPIIESLIKFGPYTIEHGYNTAGALMKMDNPPDGLFCGNDLIALGAWQRIEEMGIKMPEKMSIVGFDDIFISSLPQIQLTTIAQPRQQMGELSVSMLISAIETEPLSYVQKLILQPELKVRSSTRKVQKG